MGNVALRAAGLTKRYGRVVALDGLDLEVGTGEVHAFLGPNGAGKTTTIRILLGLLRKDGGEVSLLGGHKSLYSTSFYPEDEFYELYNGEAYRALKRAYDGEGRLLGLYEKCVTGR